MTQEEFLDRLVALLVEADVTLDDFPAPGVANDYLSDDVAWVFCSNADDGWCLPMEAIKHRVSPEKELFCPEDLSHEKGCWPISYFTPGEAFVEDLQSLLKVYKVQLKGDDYYLQNPENEMLERAGTHWSFVRGTDKDLKFPRCVPWQINIDISLRNRLNGDWTHPNGPYVMQEEP